MDYRAPVRDYEFNLFEVQKMQEVWSSLPHYEFVDTDTVKAVINEAAKFCEEVIAPTYEDGDREGCQWSDGVVITPSSFKGVYDQYVEAGWPSLSHDEAFGGQGLPESLGTVLTEFVGSSNWSWGMYPGLSTGAMNTLKAHGTDAQKETFLSKLVSGEWTGTMCLTEPHCGTDLGMLRTKAEPQDDGSYKISGTKIFISAGEHDLTDNIVHIVLARTPGAPAGTKGISLFIVPKCNVDEQGNIVDRNTVHCGSIEHKMGINGSATCVLNFDGARGYLIGPENQGLNCMFTFMNSARLGTAVQGVCHAQLGLQHSSAYARDRLQMRSLTGPKNPEGEADPIIVHPDVRRMLLTQKAIAEGGRMMMMECARAQDLMTSPDAEVAKQADQTMALLTPIAKAFLTELGFESASLGVQCFGGHGYTQEWPVEQNLRDARIAMLYEGTTGVQALDLLARKVLATQGDIMKPVVTEILTFCATNPDSPFSEKLKEATENWVGITRKIGMSAMQNPEEVGAASVDYLMYAGYVLLAYYWARAALIASKTLDAGTEDKAFYQGKVQTAEFYFGRILPRTTAHAASALSGAGNLMSMDEAVFYS